MPGREKVGDISTRTRVEDGFSPQAIGPQVVIEAEMRGKWPMLVLEVNAGRGWRNMSVAEDYADELADLTRVWHPEPDTVEEARL